MILCILFISVHPCSISSIFMPTSVAFSLHWLGCWRTLHMALNQKSKRGNGDVSAPAADPENIEIAKAAGLRYVSQRDPGIKRLRKGRGFSYVDRLGKPVGDADILLRIRSLVIPPAWNEVWICADPHGHLQAVGKDQRGRTQYRYHQKWREVRDENKYERMIEFGKALPKIRRQVRRDLGRPGLPREKVLATVVKLLETALIRVGNEEYTKENHSFGLTTMRNKHVQVKGASIHFEFRGKSGVERAVDLQDRRLARIIRSCQDLPGHELFQYLDDAGLRHAISSEDVNAYLHAIAGGDFTAKYFRTWAGTVLAAMALQEFERFDSETQAKKNIVAAIESVAKKLGNTKAVCRKCYVHPTVLNCYPEGSLLDSLKGRVEGKIKSSLRSLRPEEAAVLALLQERLGRAAKKSRGPTGRGSTNAE
jgi:DNA topoisomerase-1